MSIFARVLPVLLLLLPLSSVWAQGVGYVDMQRVLEESDVGKKVQEDLRKEFEPTAQTLGKDEQEIRTLQETLARDAPLMSKDQVTTKEEELKKRIESYQKEAGRAQQELMKVQQERAREILGPAQKAVAAVAKQKKLSMVVERSLNGLLYMDTGTDLTESVIQQMNAGKE
jgi:outer membrane protein